GLGSPWLDDSARGWLGGLTRGSGRAELARALLEGVAQRCADLAEALGVSGPLRVDGGLARSNELIQALADLVGEPVERAREPETTALGGAFLAGLAVGVWSEPADCSPAEAPQSFEPAMPAAERLRARSEWARAVERARGAQDAERSR
ncbi:MAG: FGGY-family carbohydrate kinase, partial [Myxococcota bacterium]